MHILHFLSNLYKNPTLFEKSRHIPLLRRLNKLPGRFDDKDVDTLLTFDTSGQEKTVKKSKGYHPNAGLILFSFRKIRNGNLVRYYYSLRVCAKLTRKRHETKTYLESVVQRTTKKFWMWANMLPGIVLIKYGVELKT